jgi:DNA-binding helix-turn-helix protein
MITKIARCLEVNPSFLKSDWGSDANDAIHMLFELEEAFCLEPIKVGESVVLALPEDLGGEDQEALAKALRHWYGNNRDLKDDQLTRDEYVAWKDSFKA